MILNQRYEHFTTLAHCKPMVYCGTGKLTLIRVTIENAQTTGGKTILHVRNYLTTAPHNWKGRRNIYKRNRHSGLYFMFDNNWQFSQFSCFLFFFSFSVPLRGVDISSDLNFCGRADLCNQEVKNSPKCSPYFSPPTEFEVIHTHHFSFDSD